MYQLLYIDISVSHSPLHYKFNVVLILYFVFMHMIMSIICVYFCTEWWDVCLK